MKASSLRFLGLTLVLFVAAGVLLRGLSKKHETTYGGRATGAVSQQHEDKGAGQATAKGKIASMSANEMPTDTSPQDVEAAVSTRALSEAGDIFKRLRAKAIGDFMESAAFAPHDWIRLAQLFRDAPDEVGALLKEAYRAADTVHMRMLTAFVLMTNRPFGEAFVVEQLRVSSDAMVRTWLAQLLWMPREMLPNEDEKEVRMLWRDCIVALLRNLEVEAEVARRAEEEDIPYIKAALKKDPRGPDPRMAGYRIRRWYGSPEAAEAVKDMALEEKNGETKYCLLMVLAFAARGGYKEAALWLMEKCPEQPFGDGCFGPFVYGVLYGLEPAEGARVVLQWAQEEADEEILAYHLTVLGHVHGAAVWPEVERAYLASSDDFFKEEIWDSYFRGIDNPPPARSDAWQKTHPDLLQFLLAHAYGTVPDARRIYAVHKLDMFPDAPEARNAVVHLMSDPDQDVLCAAVLNARDMRIREALPILIEMGKAYRFDSYPPKDRNEEIAMYARQAIEKIDPELYEALYGEELREAVEALYGK